MCLIMSFSYSHTHPHSELAGLFLIDPAPESLFDANPSPSMAMKDSSNEEADFKTPWSHYWYHGTVPHLQSVHVSGSLGFNRLGLMLGLMSALEVPELKTTLTDDVIAIKVSGVNLVSVTPAIIELIDGCRNIFCVNPSICRQCLTNITS